MKLLLLALLAACGPKKGETPEPPPTDGPAGLTGPTQKPEVQRPAIPAPVVAPAFKPSEPPGPPGGAVDAERLEHLRGAWRDETGAILRVESAQGALADGKPIEMMVRWCVDGGEPKVCMQLKSEPRTPGNSAYLVLVQQDDDTLVQSLVGERYAVQGPVSGGQTYARLGPPPEALPKDVRVQLGADGEPLYCAVGGVVANQCDGYYRVSRMVPLFGKVVVEETVSLVGRGSPKGCNPGIRVDETAGPTLRDDLGRIVTPVEPREDHLRRIAVATGVPQPKVTRAAWVDLDADRREELVFELYDTPADRPGYGVVGILRGGSLDVQLLEARHAANAGAQPPRVQALGLVDLRGDGNLGILTDIGGLEWVVWGIDPANGMPKTLARGACM